MKLSTTSSTRTREHNIPISIKFVKPVFGFNASYVSVSGGNVQRQAYSNLSNIHVSNYISTSHVPIRLFSVLSAFTKSVGASTSSA